MLLVLIMALSVQPILPFACSYTAKSVESAPSPRLLIPISHPPAQQPPDPEVERGRNLRVAIFLIISIVTSSLSLGIAFGIRKRIDQIGGLDQDEDD